MPLDAVAPLTARRLMARLARIQVEGKVPSVVAGLVRDGALVWSAGYGDVPGDPADTQYKIGSITKTMTAVLVHQLVAEGALTLETPVGEVLGDVGGYSDRTIRQLLAHSSGMQAEPAGPWWERSEGAGFAELVTANDGRGAVFPIGHRFHYTNLGYALLGEAVARLRGEPWWACVRSRILQRLGMDRTSYHPQAPHAHGMSVHPFSGQVVHEPNPDTGAMAPAGQVWSTISDLATYAGFLLEGHPEVLAKERLEDAYTPQSGDHTSGVGYAHALGFQLYAGGSGTLAGHAGSMPGFTATCFVDRPRRVGAVALANATIGMAQTPTAMALLDELEASEPTIPPAWRPSTPVPAEVVDVLGVWHWGMTLHTLSWEGEELVLRRDGVENSRYRVVDGRLVGISGYQAGEELRVVRREGGGVSHLDLATFILTRSPYDPEAPIPGGPPSY